MPRGFEVKGLREIQKGFHKFSFTQKNAKEQYLTMIGNSAIEMLRVNTPRDTGQLADSWMVTSRGIDYIDIGVPDEQFDILSFVSEGTQFQIAQPFLSFVGRAINQLIIDTLEFNLARSHPYFRKLPGGKQRKRQQVGRTSAGFAGGTSFAGRSKIIRPGTGRRQLKRRLSLRRRRGASINQSRKDVKMG